MRAGLRVSLPLCLSLACAPLPAAPAASPGSGGGPLGASPADTSAPGFTWQGYDAARVTVAGEVVCDRIWDTWGAASSLACVDCALVVELAAALREDVGAGEGCPGATYDIAYAWRPASGDAELPLGLLARQPGGWVWIGDAAWDGERLIGEGRFVDGERVTEFAVVGRVSPD
jgi:hypothetical protein